MAFEVYDQICHVKSKLWALQTTFQLVKDQCIVHTVHMNDKEPVAFQVLLTTFPR